MVRLASLTALLLLNEMARAADFVPLEITASPWVEEVRADGNGQLSQVIQAPPGEMPAELSGTLTAGNFSGFVIAAVSSASDSLTLALSGTATSFNTTAGSDSVSMSLGQLSEVTFQVPASPQSVVQIFADWAVTTSPGWSADASFNCSPAIEGLGPSNNTVLSANNVAPLDSGARSVGIVTLPEGETAHLQWCGWRFAVRSTDKIPGPFSATATARFRVAQPLPLGDSNADGVADLVDVVVLRRQLAGEPVP